MKKFKIAIIGECMIELQHKDGQLQQSFGGDTLNTVLYLARLCKSQEINISYVTVLGQDSFSKQMLNAWQDELIDTSLINHIPEKQQGYTIFRLTILVNVTSIIGEMNQQQSFYLIKEIQMN